MMTGKKLTLTTALSVTLVVTMTAIILPTVSAQSVPEWVRDAALWYGQEKISETEFLQAIKFLVESNIIVLDDYMNAQDSNIIIPNGNASDDLAAFYIPLHLEVAKGTTVVWVNEDAVLHTVQSINEDKKIIGMFNSAPLKTGERFSYDFDEEGTFHYFCSLHPWRIGHITVG